jgi:hypothetical protein
MISKVVKEPIHTRMEISLKVNGKKVKSKVKVSSIMSQVTNLKDSGITT